MSLSKSLGVCIGVLSLALAGCHQQLSTANPSSSQQIEIHYAPTENLEAFDNHLLRSSHDSIDICAFAFTDHELAGALTAVAGKGVKVRLYLDRGQANGEIAREERGDRRSSAIATENDSVTEDSVGVLQQLAVTPNIEVRIKHSRTLMHLKSYLVDRTELRSGSANFSPTGEKRQDNDLFVTRDRASVRRFQQKFEAMWSRPDNETMPGAARR